MFRYNLNSLYMGLNYKAIFLMGADSYLIDTESKYIRFTGNQRIAGRS